MTTSTITQKDIKKLKIKTDIVKTYYVQLGDWIYAGPFDTKEEAEQALTEAKQIAK